MDFAWTKSQLDRHKAAVEFAQQELGSNVASRDANSQFSRDDWTRCAQFGIQGMFVPAEYGGQGEDLLTLFLVMEGLGYGCRDNGLTLALNGEFVGVTSTLLNSGSEAQKQRYLRAICSGAQIGAYAMTEPESGSDAFAMSTTFAKDDDGYVLNGEKCLLTFAPIADFFLVFATEDPALGHWGVSLFIVDRDQAGVETTPPQEKMGLRSTPLGDLRLTNCRIGTDAIIGEQGSGAAIFNSVQKIERATVLVSQLGAMQFQLERTVEHAISRHQFKQPIGAFQAVSHRIADMKVRLELARLAAYRAAWLIQEGHAATTEASIANIAMAEAFVRSSLDAIMIHGGRGYLSEYGVERDLRDAIGGPIYGGTADIQRNIIARQLGL